VRTLVVDDSRTVRRILRDVLEEIGYEVLEADNGQQALERLESEKDVGLVLTDWDMPVMDGVTLLRNLRAHADYHEIPVVMVTQNSRPENVREAMRAGASDYIMKPFSRGGILEKLTALGCTVKRDESIHRVLVVDDAAVVRRMLAERIEADPHLELAGAVSNGRRALASVDADRPDIVVLDVEMPEMDGLETLTRIRARGLDLPVLMYSVLTERGARATLEALSRGAVDYVTKPHAEESREAVAERIDIDLLGKIKAICGERRRRARPTVVAPPTRVSAHATPVRLFVVAASTGGPEALAEMLGSLPVTFPTPIVVAQHMPPIFTNHFARRLDREIDLPVREAQDGDLLDCGGVWILPGGKASTLERDGETIAVRVSDVPDRGPNPSADRLFRSAAQVCGAGTVAVVMTGMGRDGLLGAAAIAAEDGRVLVQNCASSVVSSMPRAVIASGVAEQELPPDALGREVLRSAVPGKGGRA